MTAKFAQHLAPSLGPVKSKRVRTGCLTCRERHLKCDETLPNCMNCRKSNRTCRRGVRLNFLDITVHNPFRLPPSGPWTVQFRDESRQIASEYRGGLRRYADIDKQVENREVKVEVVFRQQNPCFEDLVQSSSPGEETQPTLDGSADYRKTAVDTPSAVKSNSESQPTPRSYIRTVGWSAVTGDDSNHSFSVPATLAYPDRFMWQYGLSQTVQSGAMKMHGGKPMFQATGWSREMSDLPQPTNVPQDHAIEKAHHEEDDEATLHCDTKPATCEREFLRTTEEVQYMQVFVEEVAIWMDSFDKDKHFRQFIPYQALKCPMLLNAILACGVRYMSLHGHDKNDSAQFYYNTATMQLRRNRENPDRNKAECSAAAVILTLYEHMSKKMTGRTSHAALAREWLQVACGWNASSAGIGSACFWLNIYLEVLSSLDSNCALSWHPDEWGLNIDWTNDGGEDAGVGNEELWVQRIFYILAKAASFRPAFTAFSESDPSGDKMTPDYRLPEWKNLKQLCDQWNDTCPRTMHPLGYLYPEQTKPKSLFPKVWLPKREAVFGRLLYHTAQCILTQTNPMEQNILSEEMSALQLHHAHEVCGIVAHIEDGGIGLIAIQSLTIASRVIVNHGEQMEVLRILDKIHARSGFFVGDVEQTLKATWGWDTGQGHHHEQLLHSLGDGEHIGHGGHMAAPQTGPELQTGLMPHLEDSAERRNSGFGRSRQHYQGWYEPPGQGSLLSSPLYSSLN